MATYEYKEKVALQSTSNIYSRVLWHLYKFFNACSHYTVIDAFPGRGSTPSWDSEGTVGEGAFFVIECNTDFPSTTVQWQCMFGAIVGTTGYYGQDTNTTPDGHDSIAKGLHIRFAAPGRNRDVDFAWDPNYDWTPYSAPYGNWISAANADSSFHTSLVAPTMFILTSDDDGAQIHLMEFISDTYTFFFGCATGSDPDNYYECNRGCMCGYYNNVLPATGSPSQSIPGFVFAGYPTLTNADKTWSEADPGLGSESSGPVAGTNHTKGFAFNYEHDGYDRARLSYFYGQTTSYLRGRMPGTFVNLPIAIYGLNDTNATVIFTLGYTTLLLAASQDRAWYSSDGKRRNLVRVSVPIPPSPDGAEIAKWW